jgi:hypothetical protein
MYINTTTKTVTLQERCIPPGPSVENAGPISRAMNQRLTHGGDGGGGYSKQSEAMGLREGGGGGAGVCVRCDGIAGVGGGEREGDKEGWEEDGFVVRECKEWRETAAGG